ncbi:MAG: hypothetical protein R3E12_18470 [Candidatus Eisenbacteria bacterium]
MMLDTGRSRPADTELIESLELQLDIVHASPGDLSAQLEYDFDGDGHTDVSALLDFYLAHYEGGPLPDRWSCPAELHGLYVFHFSKTEPALTSEDRALLDRFVGLPAGGVFSVSASDSDGDASTAIRGWNVTAETSGPVVASAAQ